MKARCRDCKAEHELDNEADWGPCPDCGSPHTWWHHQQRTANPRDLEIMPIWEGEFATWLAICSHGWREVGRATNYYQDKP